MERSLQHKIFIDLSIIQNNFFFTCLGLFADFGRNKKQIPLC